MSMSIYIPYFYIIQHISSGKYYAGVKHGIDSNPNNLLKSNGYKTSSNIIKQIILEEGIEAFIIRKIKIFETAEQALDYELRFLKRVNAAFNDNFLNRSNNSMRALNVDYEKKKQTCLEKYGYECSMQSPEVQEKSRQTCLKNLGVEYPGQSELVKEKSKKTNLERLGVEYPGQSEEVKEKSKKTCIEKYGVENASQSVEIKEKKEQTCLEKYGVENASKSEEVKEKIKQVMLEKYGCECPMHSEEIKEKRRQTCIALKNRPIVSEIRKYVDRFKLRLGSGWFWKKQEVLDIILAEIKITYQEI